MIEFDGVTKVYPDGQLSFSSRFADFPFYAPTSKFDDPDSLFTGWMLLSYRKAATASSTTGEFAAGRVTDETRRPSGSPARTSRARR